MRLGRAENNGQQVTGHDDRPNIFQPEQTSTLASQIMNTIITTIIFWPGISNYAGNRSFLLH